MNDQYSTYPADYAPEASAAQKRDFLTYLQQALNALGHHIRHRLRADSLDLLAIIKKEGKV